MNSLQSRLMSVFNVARPDEAYFTVRKRSQTSDSESASKKETEEKKLRRETNLNI